MEIASWIILGLLIACCVVPMLLMGRRGKHGREGKNLPPPPGGTGR